MRSWTGNLPWSAGIYDLCSALVLLQNRQVSISQVSTCKWYVRAPLWAPGQVSRTESCSKSHQAITALRIISLQWRIPCTSQNIKWSLKVYLKCLSHVPEFPRSSSDFWLCKKKQSSGKDESHTAISGTTLPVQELWYQVQPWSLSASPQLPVSKTPVSRVTCNFYNRGDEGLMGCLGIFKVWKINYSCGGMCVRKKGDAGARN